MRPCPVCGTLTAPTDEFCGNCGTYLGWNESAPTASATEATVVQPRPVQPAVPATPRPTREAAVAEPRIEGPPCPNCGTANPPGRKFCRKCAWPLTEQEQVAAPQRRKKRRRGGSGRLARTLVLLGIVVALVIAGFVLRPYGADLVQDILDKTSRPAPIHPTGQTASADTPDHPVGDAVDGVSNHYWGAPGVGAWIDFTFDHPFRLLSLVITTGASIEPKEFDQQGRPTQFDLEVTTSDGTVATAPVSLADQPGPQTVQTGVSDVVRIRLVIRSVAGVQPGRLAALGEVEFFQRS
ncbi:zinc ribbon domain-containing protein [Kutzneria sp. CA-103260]|uniref:zinc ribbon domain-containing protein n=1 Tax=Kutzneria sp. CA-103260 TaxID=2802641 RepID=UPI001BA7DE80|nr:zinc ribbon domain-containing protein [Kutzneria sp. CA-103260]QUQ63751.1 Double zinc ribbon [Kutzneria sp. CA-103260]